MTSIIVPNIGIIAAHIVGVTGSDNFCPINSKIAPRPHPKKPILSPFLIGELKKTFIPSRKIHKGSNIITVIRNL